MDAGTITQILQGVSKACAFIASVWPLSTTETVHLIGEFGGILWAALATGDWTKVKGYIAEECIKVADLEISNDAKLNLVVDAVWDRVPAKVKILPWITKDLLKIVIVQHYEHVVKPQLTKKPAELKVEVPAAPPATVATTTVTQIPQPAQEQPKAIEPDRPFVSL